MIGLIFAIVLGIPAILILAFVIGNGVRFLIDKDYHSEKGEWFWDILLGLAILSILGGIFGAF